MFKEENAMWNIERSPIDKTLTSVASGNFDNENVEILIYKYRTLDSNGLVYTEGYSSCDKSLAPLDDFAMPTLDANEIQYFKDDK